MTSVNASDGAAPATESSTTLASLVGALARAVQRELSPGDVAALRRLDPLDPAAPAFWRAAAVYLYPAHAIPLADPARLDAERRWGAVLTALAHMQGLHRADAPLGASLARAGYSELRLVRLLRAHGDALLRLAGYAARFLAAKAQPASLTDIARLVLSDGRRDEEDVRRRIARNFYSTSTD